jgi:hypothetical protein
MTEDATEKLRIFIKGMAELEAKYCHVIDLDPNSSRFRKDAAEFMNDYKKLVGVHCSKKSLNDGERIRETFMMEWPSAYGNESIVSSAIKTKTVVVKVNNSTVSDLGIYNEYILIRELNDYVIDSKWQIDNESRILVQI